MDLLLTLSGAAIVLVTIADIFFSVLFPASRRGPVRKPLSAGVWLLFRLIGGILRGPRRRDFLSYGGPVVISATLIGWFLLLNAGFALLFKPALGTAIVASSGPTPTDWAAAFYYAGFNITTLGVGDLAPSTGAYRLLTIAAAATGFAYFSMSITYFLSVYSHLTGRNAYARGLHHLTGRSGDAAALIARLADGEALDGARQHLGSKADYLRQINQSHRFYPVLRHFHYRDRSYALPRILLIALDVATLIRAALDPEHYRRLLRSAELAELTEAAHDLLAGLASDARPPHRLRRRQRTGMIGSKRPGSCSKARGCGCAPIGPQRHRPTRRSGRDGASRCARWQTPCSTSGPRSSTNAPETVRARRRNSSVGPLREKTFAGGVGNRDPLDLRPDSA